jgi:hypothetical protein
MIAAEWYAAKAQAGQVTSSAAADRRPQSGRFAASGL